MINFEEIKIFANNMYSLGIVLNLLLLLNLVFIPRIIYKIIWKKKVK